LFFGICAFVAYAMAERFFLAEQDGANRIVHICIGVALLLLLIVIYGPRISGVTGNSIRPAPYVVGSHMQDGVSLDRFKRVETNMTESEVFSILGHRGEEISRSEFSGYVTVMYGWQGKGQVGANMNVMFQNGHVVSKAQFGLQ